MKWFHFHHMSDPQACVCAGICSNPPNAVEQAKCREKECHLPPARQQQPSAESALDPHYVFRRTESIVPPCHPNAGIGGYVDVERDSDIGGYVKVDREAEIGNDHDFGATYTDPHGKVYITMSASFPLAVLGGRSMALLRSRHMLHLRVSGPVARSYQLGCFSMKHQSTAMTTVWPQRNYNAGRRTQQQQVVVRSDPTLPGQTLMFVQKIKGFISFYKTGLKELLSNSRAVSGIRARMEAGYEITREELQIERRNTGDKLRLIPFGFLVVVIPELIPLTIWLFPGICPSTCVTFSQMAKMARKQDLRRQQLHIIALQRIGSFGLQQADFANKAVISTMAASHPEAEDILSFDRISQDDVRLLNEFIGVQVRRSDGGARAALMRHLEYLRHDDRLLTKEALVDRLALSELHRACQERGIPSADYSEPHLRNALRMWLQLVDGKKTADSAMLPILWSRLVLFQNSAKTA
ncbi:hypothetical protein FB639_003050 [Coemansia asiatica]|nr:hypothetical protein FB639_003050 [Coemansia asiatica]